MELSSFVGMRPEKLAGASWVGWYMPRETDWGQFGWLAF